MKEDYTKKRGGKANDGSYGEGMNKKKKERGRHELFVFQRVE